MLIRRLSYPSSHDSGVHKKKMNKVIDIDAVFPKSPIRLSKKRMATYGASNKHHWSIPVQATPTSIIIIGVRG